MKSFGFSKQVLGVLGGARVGSIWVAGTGIRIVHPARETLGHAGKAFAELRYPARTMDMHAVSLRSLEQAILRADPAEGRTAQDACPAPALQEWHATMEPFRGVAGAHWPGACPFTCSPPQADPMCS